jgi:hypothetical protein
MNLLKVFVKGTMEFLFKIITKKDRPYTKSDREKDIPRKLTKEFTQKFLDKESDDLYGQNLENFLKIFSLFTILFLAGGFGWQSYRSIRQKLDDPFVKTIVIQNIDQVENYIQPVVKDSILAFLGNADTMKHYHINAINSFENGLNFTLSSNYKTKDYYGRSIDYHSPLLINILDDNNRIKGKNFSSVNDKGIILTKALLSELTLSSDSITTITVIPKGDPYPLRLPIVAVVNKLPKGNEFLLLNKYVDHYLWSPSEVYNFEMTDFISIGVDGFTDSEMLKSKLANVVSESEFAGSVDVSNAILEIISAINPGIIVKLPVTAVADSTGLAFDSHKFVSSVQDRLAIALGIAKDKVYPAYEKSYTDTSANYSLKGKNTKSIEITFSKLNHVFNLDNSLQFWSETKYREIAGFGQQLVFGFDLESVTLRDILKIVGFLIFTFLLIIAFLSVVSITTIITVLFEKYFQKIEKNIGTFMAFGINIKEIYRKVLIIFIVINLIFSFIFAIIIGEVIATFISWTSLVTSMNESVDLFNLFNLVPVILAAIIGAAVWRAYLKAFKIFDAWPGDIIYDRANKA